LNRRAVVTTKVLWTLPVPSTALLGSGPAFEIRPKRDAAIRFAYEAEDDSRKAEALVFHGVEAFKCTYYLARDASMREAYDKLVDRGPSAWLEEVSANLNKNGADAQGLMHLMINFDDGPAYEVVCRSFGVEKE
jgi:hypothetical protein